jgi:hypothetical protein
MDTVKISFDMKMVIAYCDPCNFALKFLIHAEVHRYLENTSF